MPDDIQGIGVIPYGVTGEDIDDVVCIGPDPACGRCCTIVWAKVSRPAASVLRSWSPNTRCRTATLRLESGSSGNKTARSTGANPDRAVPRLPAATRLALAYPIRDTIQEHTREIGRVGRQSRAPEAATFNRRGLIGRCGDRREVPASKSANKSTANRTHNGDLGRFQ